MRALSYLVIGIILFYIDTIIGLVIPMHIGKFEIIFVPHLTLLFILLLTIYRGFGVGLILGGLLGIVTDLYLGSVYGLYMFGYILLVLLFDNFLKVFYRDYTMMFILNLCSVVVFEIYIACIYAIIGFINFNNINFLLLRLLPTILLNFILLIIVFPIFLKYIKKMQNKIDTKV
ncbi:rod shape-determining protein MreD [Staphylococcus devriesei]|uniref:rod shape-determining protein MreD n=1 Tax=Staphylococcus devriesei TaxID=586733 RepID=UPI000E67E401|nr:rod shape-determining protein MreD [Staphylococcus devriesei]RIL72213.1 rod shape-determining protein MreD [Staphylococcus devriesei]